MTKPILYDLSCDLDMPEEVAKAVHVITKGFSNPLFLNTIIELPVKRKEYIMPSIVKYIASKGIDVLSDEGYIQLGN